MSDIRLKVTPDLTDFERQIQQLANKIQTNSRFKMPVALDFSKATTETEAFFKKISAKLSTPIKVKLDLTEANKAVEALQHKIQALQGRSGASGSLSGAGTGSLAGFAQSARLEGLATQAGGSYAYTRMNPNSLVNMGSATSTTQGSTLKFASGGQFNGTSLGSSTLLGALGGEVFGAQLTADAINKNQAKNVIRQASNNIGSSSFSIDDLGGEYNPQGGSGIGSSTVRAAIVKAARQPFNGSSGTIGSGFGMPFRPLGAGLGSGNNANNSGAAFSTIFSPLQPGQMRYDGGPAQTLEDYKRQTQGASQFGAGGGYPSTAFTGRMRQFGQGLGQGWSGFIGPPVSGAAAWGQNFGASGANIAATAATAYYSPFASALAKSGAIAVGAGFYGAAEGNNALMQGNASATDARSIAMNRYQYGQGAWHNAAGAIPGTRSLYEWMTNKQANIESGFNIRDSVYAAADDRNRTNIAGQAGLATQMSYLPGFAAQSATVGQGGISRQLGINQDYAEATRPIQDKINELMKGHKGFGDHMNQRDINQVKTYQAQISQLNADRDKRIAIDKANVAAEQGGIALQSHMFDISAQTATTVAGMQNTNVYGASLAGIEGNRQLELAQNPDKKAQINAKYNAIAGQTQGAFQLGTTQQGRLNSAMSNVILGAQQQVNGFGFKGVATSIQGSIDQLEAQKKNSLDAIQGTDQDSQNRRAAVTESFNNQIAVARTQFGANENARQSWSIGMNASEQSLRQATKGDFLGAAQTGINADFEQQSIQFRNDPVAMFKLTALKNTQMASAGIDESRRKIAQVNDIARIGDSTEAQLLRNQRGFLQADVTDVERETQRSIVDLNNNPQFAGAANQTNRNLAIKKMKENASARVAGILNPLMQGTNYAEQTDNFMFGGAIDQNPYRDLQKAKAKAANLDKDLDNTANSSAPISGGDANTTLQQILQMMSQFLSQYTATNGG